MRPRTVDPAKSVQIKFLLKDRTISALPTEPEIIPVLENISIEQQSPGGIYTTIKITALIDTGADHFLVDREVMRKAGFKPSGITSFSTVSEEIQGCLVYKLDCTTPTAPHLHVFEANFVAADLAEQKRGYQVILGMSFIQKGRLILDFKAQNFLFEFN